MELIKNEPKPDLAHIFVDDSWNVSSYKGCKMHSIHSYPAKFPAFIAEQAIKHARSIGITPETVADIFCGCGTVALECKQNNIRFWGCDISQIATLIAKTKITKYNAKTVKNYFDQITEKFEINLISINPNSIYDVANERLKYWYNEKHYHEIYCLKKAIYDFFDKNEKNYFNLFKCALSNILKSCSKWLTKSIKPTIDKNKSNCIDVYKLFKRQIKKTIFAIEETNFNSNEEEIVTENALDIRVKNKADLIITSPPYVTSYEYADLHQLSSLWLGFSKDYRDLRKNTIGSLYHMDDFKIELNQLNEVGSEIVRQLQEIKCARAKSAAKYYIDMQEITKKSYSLLKSRGAAFFVIGDTEYKGVKMENAAHLVKSLYCAGFNEVQGIKRNISNKLLTPYRSEDGKFTRDKSARKVYSQEYVILGIK